MGNPVQNLFDKLTKGNTEPTTKSTKTVSGKSNAGTSAKAKAAGQAKVGGKTTRPVQKTQAQIDREAALKKQNELNRKAEFQKQLDAQKQGSLATQKEAIAKKTNQDIINAAYKVADELKLAGGPWPLLRAAGWGHLTDNRGSLYKGPAIDEIESLTPEQKVALKRILGL
ncbi:MAG: hypothetical protein AB2L18_11875 [Anaerolineaceae bacterium]